MKIKKGQWVRTSINSIVKIKSINVEWTHKLSNKEVYFDFTGIYTGTVLCSNNIIKVADTPQELVQVGDLIGFDYSYYKNDLVMVHSLIDDEIEFGNSYRIKNKFYDHITKILTPNSNGDFIKRWEE